MIANVLHHESSRRHQPFVAVSSASLSLDDRLHELEANLIAWALKVTGGNKSKAADLLQIKRSTLGDRIARSGLSASPPLDPPPPVHRLRLFTSESV